MMQSFIPSANLLLILCCMAGIRLKLAFSNLQSSLNSVQVYGHFSFEGNEFAADDFGHQFHHHPLAVLHPRKVSDISNTIRHVWQMGPTSGLTVAARGLGHSAQGQAQAHQGIVINMRTLNGIQVHKDADSFYVDVSAGELWIDVLNECLKHGLAPKSWTDYLHLTVGGTLSNGGLSGQAFKHGPQISNVLQLEVVTGLFHGVLGGLGQFGVITRARISLEPAPKMVYNLPPPLINVNFTHEYHKEMVKWIRVLYQDFATFTRDQEQLISTDNTFDYVEGLVIVNKSGLINNWRSSFDAQDPEQADKFVSDGKILYCLEMTKNFDPDEDIDIENEVWALLSKLSYIPSTLFVTEVSYLRFLDRVHAAELKLRSKGLWEIPHPWLNLLVPKSKILKFAEGVFGSIVTETNNGPVLVYPLTKSK